MRLAMVSMSASPLTALESADGAGRGIDVGSLSRALAARGHEVVVHTRRDSLDLPAHVRVGPGVTVHHVDAGPLRPVDADEVVALLPRFAGELAQRWLLQPPHVAHAHFWDSGVASVQAAAAAGVPVAMTFHALGRLGAGRTGPSTADSPSRLDVERSLARGTHQVIAPSAAEMREVLMMGAPPQRVAVVPHGVDSTLFSPDGPAASRVSRHHRLLSVGRLSPDGGADDAIRIVAQVPVAELVVVGGPPAAALDRDSDVARLRLLAQDLGVADRVRFTGAVPRADLPALIRSADIVVCLPWYDPPVGVALAAMACGRPFVAAAAGGLLEVVDDGVTGLLVEPQSPNAAALAVRRMLESPALRDAMGVHARSRAHGEFDWRHVARAAEQVYRSMRAPERAAGYPAALRSRVPAAPFGADA